MKLSDKRRIVNNAHDYKYIAYLAGPITGLSYEGATDWRAYAKSKLDPSIAGMSPLRGKSYLSQVKEIKDTYEDIAMSCAKGITARDFNDCRRADIVIANLKGADRVSIGTVIEIAWAKAFNVPCIAVIDDGDMHDHAMIRESVGFIVNTLDEAIHIANAVLIPDPESIAEYSDKEYK